MKVHLHVFARHEHARLAFDDSKLIGKRRLSMLEIEAPDGLHRFIAPPSIEGVHGLVAASATFDPYVDCRIEQEVRLRIRPESKT